MKIALVTDTHWGVRGESALFLSVMTQFFEGCFFPRLLADGIKTIVHLGDLVDRKKFVNYYTADQLQKSFISPIVNNGMFCHALVGNHDSYFRNNLEVNAVRSFLYPLPGHFNIVESPKGVLLGGEGALLVPWICEANEQTVMEFIEKTPARLCFGHFDLTGYDMHKGMKAEVGRDRSFLKKFKWVYSGHYHEQSEEDNVKYLGAPYEMTWADAGCPRGFHILETDTMKTEFVPNPWAEVHVKVHYDDTASSFENIMGVDFDGFGGKIVKIVVHKRENPFWFDKFVEGIEEAGGQVTTVWDHMNVDQVSNAELTPEKEHTDVLQIMSDYVSDFEVGVDKQALGAVLRDLYTEAVQRGRGI